MKIYIAGPLFNVMELERNKEMKAFVSSLGFETYLPQEDAGIVFTLAKDGNVDKIKSEVFKKDITALHDCDMLLALLDGRTTDEGTCFEIGYAYALGKKCVGYKTDIRTLNKYGDNPMIEKSLSSICSSQEELASVLSTSFLCKL